MGLLSYKPTGKALEVTTVIMCGSAQLLFGYDQGVLSGFVGTENFLSVFGYPDSGLVGTITSIYNIGCLFGAIAASFIGDRIGRKKTILLGNCVVIIGAILQATAYSVAHIIVGRIVTGLGTGLNTTTVPILQSELSHSHRRGKLVIMETAITIAGIAAANWIDYGIIYGGHVQGSAQWRLALALQCAFPLFVFALIGSVPESPRWLATKGRYDEVRAAIAQIQGGGATTTSESVVIEADKIIRVAEHEAAIAVGWRELFRSGELQNGRRVLLGAFGQFMQQFGGINLLAYYAPIIFTNSLGLDAELAQILAGVGATCFFLGSMVPIPFIETVGRRVIMQLGGITCCIFMTALAVSTAIIEQNPGTAKATSAGWAACAFIFLYYFCFGATWNGVPWLYAPEINSLRTRNRAVAASTSSEWLSNYVVVQVTPSGVENLGYKFYIIWAVFNAVFVPIVYFFYFETSGRTLEDMDEMFAKNPGWIVKKEYRQRGTTRSAEGEEDEFGGVDGAVPSKVDEKAVVAHKEG